MVQAECWVDDNGSGIPEERLEKVFDKGETDPDTAGGRAWPRHREDVYRSRTAGG